MSESLGSRLAQRAVRDPVEPDQPSPEQRTHIVETDSPARPDGSSFLPPRPGWARKVGLGGVGVGCGEGGSAVRITAQPLNRVCNPEQLGTG